MCNFVPHLV